MRTGRLGRLELCGGGAILDHCWTPGQVAVSAVCALVDRKVACACVMDPHLGVPRAVRFGVSCSMLEAAPAVAAGSLQFVRLPLGCQN